MEAVPAEPHGDERAPANRYRAIDNLDVAWSSQEIWHPALTAEERAALAQLFALKDRFTVLSLRMCPWGFSEEELTRAIVSKDVFDTDFWRDLAHGL